MLIGRKLLLLNGLNFLKQIIFYLFKKLTDNSKKIVKFNIYIHFHMRIMLNGSRLIIHTLKMKILIHSNRDDFKSLSDYGNWNMKMIILNWDFLSLMFMFLFIISIITFLSQFKEELCWILSLHNQCQDWVKFGGELSKNKIR